MTNAEARFNKSLRPRKPEGSLGRTAQDVRLDSHTVPELWSLEDDSGCGAECPRSVGGSLEGGCCKLISARSMGRARLSSAWSPPNSKHWFTTSFLQGGVCRKAMLGVWVTIWMGHRYVLGIVPARPAVSSKAVFRMSMVVVDHSSGAV